MHLSLEVPDSIAQQLHLDGEQGTRRALEMFALEGYRSGELSRGQINELLHQSYEETEAFLKEHGCGLGMTFDEHEESLHRVREILAR